MPGSAIVSYVRTYKELHVGLSIKHDAVCVMYIAQKLWYLS